MNPPAVPVPPRPALRRVLVGLAVVAIGVLVGPAASAHGGEAAIEVVSRTPAAPGSVTYEINVEFEDGHGAAGAAVTAVAELADGTAVGPLEMAPGAEEGRYTVTVDFPTAGAWTVRFSSAEPEVTSSVDETVTDVATTTAAPDAAPTTVPTTTAADQAGSGAAPTTTSGTEAADTTATDDDSETSDGLWIALGAVAVVVLVGTFVITRRTKRDDS